MFRITGVSPLQVTSQLIENPLNNFTGWLTSGVLVLTTQALLLSNSASGFHIDSTVFLGNFTDSWNLQNGELFEIINGGVGFINCNLINIFGNTTPVITINNSTLELVSNQLNSFASSIIDLNGGDISIKLGTLQLQPGFYFLNNNTGNATIDINEINLGDQFIKQTDGYIDLYFGAANFNSGVAGIATLLDIANGNGIFYGNEVNAGNPVPTYEIFHFYGGSYMQGYIANANIFGGNCFLIGDNAYADLDFNSLSASTGVPIVINTSGNINIQGNIIVANQNDGIHISSGTTRIFLSGINATDNGILLSGNAYVVFKFLQIDANVAINVSNDTNLIVEGNRIQASTYAVEVDNSAVINMRVVSINSNNIGIYSAGTDANSNISFHVDDFVSTNNTVSMTNAQGKELYEGRYVSKNGDSFNFTNPSFAPNTPPRFVNTVFVANNFSINSNILMNAQFQSNNFANSSTNNVTVNFGTLTVDPNIY